LSSITQQIVEMLDMLPEKEQQLACEVLKRLVLAWDPDYAKLTPAEAKRLSSSMKELEAGDFVEWTGQ
jgi:hypothetical protein